MMELPNIGDNIDNQTAIKLCEHYGLDYLVERIQANANAFSVWEFGGASMIPDGLFSAVFNIPNLTEIALQHDLKYAYGEPGNKEEKLRADLEFELSLLNDGASVEMAKMMFAAVDLCGDGFIRTDFSWGFARL
ncbi:MAG: hypothetical protein PSN04_03375 [Methyloprofundus sp.]|nr:hypothetical protein [Methyloprofundus sp.]